jgi:peptidoglycan hydrolase CwlO-like protein
MLKKCLSLQNVILVIVITLGIGLCWNNLTLAQGSATQLEYRMSRLESQVSQLIGQINSLQYQRSGTTVIQVKPDPTNPAPELKNPLISGDPMFDRLATLVIETKQDVQELQKQIAELKAQLETK